MSKLLQEIQRCQICADGLPFLPRPILQFHTHARYLIVGQAPGIKAHESGIPWSDASGIRLREWLQIRDINFYNPKLFSILPMSFCYPGKGKSGDLPPRRECSIRWMDSLLTELTHLKRIILVGNYAANYFLGDSDLTTKIKDHARNSSPFIVLPHPSPRNNIWLAKNAWFEQVSLSHIRKKFSYSNV
jgi:uracil-DNA glycosylase